MGRNEDSHVKSSSQISIPINLENGQLNNLGHSKSWVPDRHPDTGYEFKNKIIPNFNRIVSKAIELQNAMCFVKCIGWDMVLDADHDIQVMGGMEWFYMGIGFAEFTEGPCFKDLEWESLWKSVL